jgi:hypothetical protein
MPIFKEVHVPTGRLKGVDFAWRPAGSDAEALAIALKRQGVDFVVRYISHDTSKNLTLPEITAYRKHGIAICVVFEDTADRALDGGAAGVTDAIFTDQYRRGLHAPQHAPVYWAMDFDMQPAQVDRCRAYLRGAVQRVGRSQSGIYGGLRAVEAFAPLTAYQWQTVAWSHNTWFAGDEMKQFAAGGTTLGVQWDLDTTTGTPDFGQWRFPGEPGPVPKPVHFGTGDEENEVLIGANPAGTHRTYPLAIPPGTNNLHFVTADEATLEVNFHGETKPHSLDVKWANGSKWLPVPPKIYAATVTRTDTGTGAVHLTFAPPNAIGPAVPAA